MASSVSRKVLKAMGLFTSVQAITVLCSLLRAKFLAIWVGQAGVGLFGIFNSAIDTVSAATQLGLRSSSVREIASASADDVPRIAASVRWWARMLGLLGAVVMLTLSPLLSVSSFGSVGYWWMFACLSVVLMALSVAQGEQALMQGTGALKSLARCSVVGAVAGTAMSLPLFYFFGEASVVPSIIIFGLSALVAVLVARRVPSALLPASQCIALGKGFIRLGAYFTLSSFAAIAAAYALKSYLTQSYGIDVTGLYQAGYTMIVGYVGIVFSAIGTEFYPRLSGVAMRSGMASKVVSHEISLLMCLLAPLCVVFLSADVLCVRVLYSDDFLPVLPMISVGIAGVIFRAISYCMAFVMMARADGKCFVVVEVTSALVGLALNIVGYRLWGMAGLGISYVAWYALYSLMVAAVYFLRYRMCVSPKCVALMLGAIVLTTAAVWLRTLAWWAPLPLLIPSAAMAIFARK